MLSASVLTLDEENDKARKQKKKNILRRFEKSYVKSSLYVFKIKRLVGLLTFSEVSC